jgi:hypothetical protein
METPKTLAIAKPAKTRPIEGKISSTSAELSRVLNKDWAATENEVTDL